MSASTEVARGDRQPPTFDICEICDSVHWTALYSGIVRDGVFGRTRAGATVSRCGGCGADRLHESVCPDDAFYETTAYRTKLQEELSAAGHAAVADELQIFNQQVLWPRSLRGRTIADVGCAGGSFLDTVVGTADRCVAIEPCNIYHESLRQRGYDVFSYASDARGALAGKIDVAVSMQVIEHVRNPRAFLQDIRPLLAPDGILILSTPNRDDILLDLLPEDFPSFFYRVVHRWYFDAASLRACAARAGFALKETRYVHRYGMANAVAWLRDRRPTGRTRLDALTPLADDLWRTYLESSGRSDCIYAVLTPNG